MMVYHSAKKLKISIIVSDISTSGAGRWGGAVRTFLLAQALEKLGHEVEILGFVFGDNFPDTSSLPFQIKAIKGKNYPNFLQSARQLMGEITGDILYALRPKVTSFGVALWSKKIRKKPLILDIDDWELGWQGGDKFKYPENFRQLARDIIKPDGALRFPDHRVYLKWMEKTVSSADLITVHTEFLKSRFGGIYIPNGKDTDLFNPENYDVEKSRVKYNLQNYRILMFPGAPRPYKGVEDVLMALDQLNQEDLRLVIVGGSPYDDYEQKLQKKWGKWLINLPQFPAVEMPEIVAAAHIVVVPQRDTPVTQAQFPLKLTDGMSMAKPILATRVGDIPKLLSDTGFLVDPESPEQIADKIQWIFDHYDQAILAGSRARERCVDHYSVNCMATILEDVIKQLGY
ncbi:glycosyltransferase family 4 protein [Spirulina subsalsa]|uniref:glycosyltransferase family 4 protein n=1 Tax=Spirulina subsalsa TaxID=54311 RepID=UPI00037F5FCF|nr:glycosyltransferase family 4 protein [Spirulina subsalsa]